MFHQLAFRVVCLASLVCVGCSGGSNGDSMIRDANKNSMQRLANLYTMFQASHGWKGPKDEKEFRSFIAGADPSSLAPMGVSPTNIDPLFVSDRDGKAFKVRYAVQGSMGSKEPVIFESTGKDGKYLVAFTGMIQKEVDKSEYDSLFEGKGSEQVQRIGPPQ